MKKKKITLNILFGMSLALTFIACDKDFANVDSDVLSDDNAISFNIKDTLLPTIAYTKALGPVQTNNLNLNSLGVYVDSYGKTTSSILTQIAPTSFAPDFGNNTVLDSVVLTMPYFSRRTGVTDDGNFEYELDSIIGDGGFNLKIFESNFFLRDFDPNGDFDTRQSYFSNQSASSSEAISSAVIENLQLGYLDANGAVTTADLLVTPDNSAIILTDGATTDPEILARQTPAIRLKLDVNYWNGKIISMQDDVALSNANNFLEYFRGLYFKAEQDNTSESYAFFNLASQNANITLYYTKDNESTSATADPTVQDTYVLNFGTNNRINFHDNVFTSPIVDGDAINGDARLYLKGTEGSMANIKLFNGEDVDNIAGDNAFEEWKNFFVETDNGSFVKSKRLVNEANLIFYVDDAITTDEPQRVYIYDTKNEIPLVDYYLDAINTSIPAASVANHLEPLESVENQSGGTSLRYKIKLTEHINNILLRDSTNVKLGLAISGNVNLEESTVLRQVQSSSSEVKVPVSSVITPRGTVLHGSDSEDDTKKVYLQIFYTCIEEDCQD